MPRQILDAHCNKCGGEREHVVLHVETSRWEVEDTISGSDTYQLLKCGGCREIKLRHAAWNSEEQDSRVSYFPPAIFRPRPAWFNELGRSQNSADVFVERLLDEIYIALQNNLPNLAVMGVRSLLEKVMISKVGDHGSFNSNISEFVNQGYLSRRQSERLETILEAGHAAIHRTFEPEVEDVVTLLDITEHLVETVYLHESKVAQLKSRVPPRPPRRVAKKMRN